MIDVLRDDDVREQPFAGQRLLDCLGRRRSFDDAVVAVRAGILCARGLDHDEAGRLVLELLCHGFADARLGVTTAAPFVGLRDVDLDASPWQMRGQWTPSRGAAPLMLPHGRVARVHFDRLGDRAGFVRELLKGQLELPRVDAF
jgi:hypothetical protein